MKIDGAKYPVEVGQIVWWYPDSNRNQRPSAAIVTAVGSDSVCLAIFSPVSYNLWLRDGVRHIDDPETRAPELLELGCWDYTNAWKDYQDLKKKVESLWSDLKGGK